jgi:hypothetical protein
MLRQSGIPANSVEQPLHFPTLVIWGYLWNRFGGLFELIKGYF